MSRQGVRLVPVGSWPVCLSSQRRSQLNLDERCDEDVVEFASVFPTTTMLPFMSYSSSHVIMLTPRFSWFGYSILQYRVPEFPSDRCTAYFHQVFEGLGQEVFLQIDATICLSSASQINKPKFGDRYIGAEVLDSGFGHSLGAYVGLFCGQVLGLGHRLLVDANVLMLRVDYSEVEHYTLDTEYMGYVQQFGGC
ncbi:hypothetical protein HAX54_037338 [Datura stramonium]|uniref:Uncharacterized protein n=1 Tax=Datura stramonium TaxID=4076 RepID=A0ABS8RPR1_DATST|nr:hypothetical protein [Datura stramonium]